MGEEPVRVAILTASVMVSVRVEPSVIEWGLWGWLLGLLIVAGIGAYITKVKAGGPRLPAGGTWTWSDSWASNLTAILTALGAAATFVSDQLEPLVDQAVVVAFGLTAALLLVGAACAPLVYAACQVVTDDAGDQKAGSALAGTWYGWCLASAVTVGAVEGSLSAALRSVGLTAHGGLRAAVLAVVGAIMLLVLGYAARTFWLVHRSTERQSFQGVLPGVTTEKSRGPGRPPEIRMTLM